MDSNIITNQIQRNITQLEPIINEKIITNKSNLLLATILGIIAILSLLATIYIFNLDIKNSLIATSMVLGTCAIILFILIQPSIVRNIKTREIETITKPVFQEVIKEIPFIKKVYIEKPRAKLNIPRYKFRGSSETKTYTKLPAVFQN